MNVRFDKQQIELAILMRYPEAKNFSWDDTGICVSFDVKNKKPCSIPISEEQYESAINERDSFINFLKGQLDQANKMHNDVLKFSFGVYGDDDDDEEEEIA